MLIRIAATFLCTAAPAALLAQQVVLESTDQFISVQGEIVGYNGVMVRVRTVVGEMAVPASEVVCFGDACLDVIANNDFGLTAASFQNVVGATAPQETGGAADLQIAFASASYQSAYNTVAGAFSGASVDDAGVVTLQDETGASIVSLTASDDPAAADILVATVPLGGTSSRTYASPADWAVTDSPSHQLIGLQSYSVVVAPNAGITSISMNDLARVYAGEVTNWSQIGGADMGVLPLQLPTTSRVRSALDALIMEPAGKQIAGNVLTMSDEAGIVASINQFPGSISVVSGASADAAQTIPVSGSCPVAVAATPFSIASGDYPLVRPVMARFNASAGGALTSALFDFAATTQAQTALSAEGFDSFAARPQASTDQNARLSQLLSADLDDAQRTAAGQMFQVLFGAQRMSPTLTGGAASGPEGAWNRAMLQSVIEAIADPANSGREVILVGFGESTAGSQAAIDASAAAAADIRAALAAEAGSRIAGNNVSLVSFGFGNVSLPTCVDGQVAGSEYTRVEVWLR